MRRSDAGPRFSSRTTPGQALRKDPKTTRIRPPSHPHNAPVSCSECGGRSLPRHSVATPGHVFRRGLRPGKPFAKTRKRLASDLPGAHNAPVSFTYVYLLVSEF